MASITLFEVSARDGVETGIDLNGAIETARFLGRVLNKTTPGMVSRAGGFPSAA